MSLPTYLANIKSSGIYRFVWDKSEIPSDVDVEVLRLVVGYSEKGPFNTPVYITSQTEFRQVFGGVSKKLERYGAYFHRLAMQALRKGPILCLNLKTFTDETVEAVSFNPQNLILSENDGTPLTEALQFAIKDIYNTDRFWTLEPEMLEEMDAEKYSNANQYITITATDSKESSNTIFVRGYEPVNYDITFKEWFSSVLNGADMPSYLEGYENNKLNQYWAEVYVFKGEFTKEIASSDVLSKYFDVDGNNVKLKDYIVNAFGEKKDTLSALASNEASNFINKYQGILLPEFPSASGSTISLDILFNNDNQIHKMMMRLNQNALYEGTVDLDDIDTTGWKQTMENTSWSRDEQDSSIITIEPKSPLTAWPGAMSLKNTNPVFYIFQWNDEEWVSHCSNEALDGLAADFYTYDIGGLYAETDPAIEPTCSGYDLTLPSDTDGDILNALQLMNIQEGDKWVVKFKDTATNEGDPTGIQICTITKITTTNTETVKKMVVTFDTDLTNIDEDFFDPTDGGIVFKCVGSVLSSSLGLVPTYLVGYTYQNATPDQTATTVDAIDPQMKKNSWVEAQLAVLKDAGLREALTNNINVQYRYLVDTFESFAVPGECKAGLALICKLKNNVLGLLNFPSMKSFSKCRTMSFRDNTDKKSFDTKYIPMGNNPQLPAYGKFSLASQDNGASWVSYNTPLMISDPETGVKTTIPAAALVSNNFMDKFTKYFPYTIIAGVNRGVISDPNLIGPDFSFGRYDLDNLEPMGVNCMVYVPGKGTYINSNQTAKQNPVTALSKIHIRELCTFIQDEIEKMMEDYHWDFNTPNLRATIKDRADVICETCKNNQGIYAYYNDTSEETANTPEVIDNEMFILRTSIEPSRGAGKMIQELTLYRTGALEAAIKDA